MRPLRRWPGAPQSLKPLEGLADFETAKGGKRLEFIPVRISGVSAEGLPQLARCGPGGSARLQPLTQADGLATLPIADEGIKKGARLDYYPLSGAF